MRGSAIISLAVVLTAVTTTARSRELENIIVEVNGARYLTMGDPIRRVSIGNKKVADISAFPPDQVLVVGKRPGRTAATLWGERKVRTIPIIVQYPVQTIAAALRQAIPGARNIEVSTAGSALVLTGEVVDPADATHAVEIAKGFMTTTSGPGESSHQAQTVVNRLGVAGDHQVQLEVCFSEVSRTALRQLGLNVWHAGSNRMGGMLNPANSLTGVTSGSSIGDLQGGGLPPLTPPLSGAFGLLFSLGTSTELPFTAALSVLTSKGYARTLAEPTLVALSGHEASFLAGGEFPIPMPQALGQITIEYKKFGVHLKFLPTVVGGAIQLNLETTVSDLDQALGIKLASVSVPGLTARHSSTTIRLRDGQSFAVAGMLSDKVRSNVDKIPGLGDLPVLGALFRSVSYRREETELLVVVTARLVRPLDQMPRGPGWNTRTDPSDLELFLFYGRESLEGGAPRREKSSAPPKTSTGAPIGPVGFARGD